MIPISEVLQHVVDYLPRAASAILFAWVGLVAARLVHGALYAAAQGSGLGVSAAVGQCGLQFSGGRHCHFDDWADGVAVSDHSDLPWGGALSLALAMGLGMKDIFHNIASDVYTRDMFMAGMEVILGGKRYEVLGIGANSTRIEGAGIAFVMVLN